jgi:hypothetical protein
LEEENRRGVSRRAGATRRRPLRGWREGVGVGGEAAWRSGKAVWAGVEEQRAPSGRGAGLAGARSGRYQKGEDDERRGEIVS